jgi:hypothetical protein
MHKLFYKFIQNNLLHFSSLHWNLNMLTLRKKKNLFLLSQRICQNYDDFRNFSKVTFCNFYKITLDRHDSDYRNTKRTLTYTPLRRIPTKFLLINKSREELMYRPPPHSICCSNFIEYWKTRILFLLLNSSIFAEMA